MKSLSVSSKTCADLSKSNRVLKLNAPPDLVSKMEDVTKCQKCSHTCMDPRILQCFHTFCLKCLEGIRSDGKTGEPMPCPRCGTVTVIPATGFRENEFVKRLIRVETLSKPVETGLLCDACRNDELEPKEAEATAFCLECRNILCQECCRVHRRPRPCRNHTLLSFGRLPKNELEIKLDLDFCEHHEMIPLEKYCEDCKVVICNICLAEVHKSHRCSDIKVAKNRLQRQIFDEVEKLDIISSRVLGINEELEKKKRNFMEEIQYTETAVKTRGQELKDLIDRHTEALLGDIGKCQREGLERLSRKRTDLDLHSAIVSSFKTYCNSLCDKGSSYDVCSPVSQIIDRVKELKTQNDFHVQRHLPLPTMKLQKADLSEFDRLSNVIGDIKVTQPPEIIHTANLDLSGFSVMGVAKLKKAVYILCRPPHETVLLNDFLPASVIRVYNDHQPFTLNNEIKLDMATSPFDMAPSETNDCLYVTDLNQVFKMTVNQQFSRFLPWKWNPHTLSVSKEGLVMLGKDDKPCCLERYTSKADLVDRIQLPTDVASVKHAVETSNGNFLVLLELATDLVQTSIRGKTEFPNWKRPRARGIYEVTNAGKIVRWFSPWTQSYQLDDPRHLALDSDGQVFVADHAKDRMTQFDSELNMVQVIERPGMFGPKRLFYDKAKQQLWIGHSKKTTTGEDISGSINICKITPYIEQPKSSCP